MIKNERKVVFLDRDGVINKEVVICTILKILSLLMAYLMPANIFKKLVILLLSSPTNLELLEAIIKKRIFMY